MGNGDINKVYNWVIYKITNPKGRIYIGKTIDYERRMKYYGRHHCKGQRLLLNSFNKYGFLNHTVDILETFVSESDFAANREVFWINEYKSNLNRWRDNKGLNLTDGGEGVPGYVMSEATKQKLRDDHKANPRRNNLGKKWTQEQRDKIAAMWKIKSERIKKNNEEKRKISEEERKIKLQNRIKKTVWNKGIKSKLSEEERKLKFGSHHLGNSYSKGLKRSDEVKKAQSLREKGRLMPKLCKAIIQYDISGNFIKDFTSIKSASLELGIDRVLIVNVLRNRENHTHKFIFKYKADNTPVNRDVSFKETKSGRVILQYTIGGAYIKEHKSIKEAVKNTKVSYRAILSSLQCTVKNSRRFIFIYKGHGYTKHYIPKRLFKQQDIGSIINKAA